MIQVFSSLWNFSLTYLNVAQRDNTNSLKKKNLRSLGKNFFKFSIIIRDLPTLLFLWGALIPEVNSFVNGTNCKEPTCHAGDIKGCRLDTWVRKIFWRKAQQSTPVFLPGESHGQRSLVGYGVTKSWT